MYYRKPDIENRYHVYICFSNHKTGDWKACVFILVLFIILDKLLALLSKSYSLPDFYHMSCTGML